MYDEALVDVSIVWQWVRQIENPLTGGASLCDKLWSVHTCSVVMSHKVYWVEELICSDQHITTYELCSTLSFNNGSVMIVVEEVDPRSVLTGCLKCWWMHAKKPGCYWSIAPIWHWSWGLPITDCHGEWNLGLLFWTWIKVAVDRSVPHDIPAMMEKFRHVLSAEEVWIHLFGMK